MMKKASADLTPPQDLYTSTQIEKLNLEIESLRKRIKWEPFVQFIPLVSAIVLAFGLVFSVIQFLNGQRKDRVAREIEQRTKVETQIRADRDEIFKLARDETKTFSGISFLFADLERATASRVSDDPKLVDEFRTYRRPFTQGLFSLIKDLDLKKNPRGLAFALLALDHWTDYKIYLRENPSKLDFILNAYVRGLSSISEKYPNYLDGIRFVGDQFKPLENEDVEGLWPQFLDIVSGFKKHVELIADDPKNAELEKIKQNQVRAFVLVMNKEELARSLLGHMYIDPKAPPTASSNPAGK